MPEHYAICPLCEATCGLKVSTEGDRVTAIRGHSEDIFSQGYICPKGYALKALEEDPDWLRQPLIRTGTEWREASWDEAFALIREHLPGLVGQHGRDAVALYLGNPNVHNLSGQLYLPALIRALGTRNLYSASSLDQLPKHLTCGLMFGDPMSIPIPDLDRTQYLLIIGANPLVSNGSLMTAPNVRARLKKIRQRGGKIVVLDPRRTLTAEAADEHHFVRPGRDCYCLLGLVHTLLEEGLTRPGPHVMGLETMAELSRPFTPERVGPLCGLESTTLRRLARELAACPEPAVYGRLGTCTQEFGTLTSWLIDVVNVLTGALDRPGGVLFPKAAAGARNTVSNSKGFRLTGVLSRVHSLPQVNGEFPTATLADEILTEGPGQVRALITVAGNPARSAPQSDRLQQALESLDFMVSVDGYLNETTRFARVILPVPGHLQRSHYDLVFNQLAVRNQARFSDPVFPLRPGQLDEWEVLLRLAAVVAGVPATVEQMDLMVANQLVERESKAPDSPLLGCEAGGLLAGRGPERLLNILLKAGPYPGLSVDRLRSGGVDLGPLQPRLPEILRTPSGKVELAPDILVQEARKLTLQAPASEPGMVLIGRRELRSNNSWMHNLPLLVKGPSVCTLLIHPQSAQELGLADGDIARVTSAVGSLEIAVERSDSIMPGVVSVPHGWGHGATGTRMSVAAAHAGVNANRLVPAGSVDALSGNAVQNAVPVRVERVGQGPVNE